jgi:MFS family permease
VTDTVERSSQGRSTAVGAWFMVSVLCASNAFSFADRQLIALFAEPIKESFGLTDTELGLLQGTAFGLFYAILGLPLAWLSDRTVRRNVIAAGAAVWSLMTALAGLVTGFPGFLLTRVGVGVGEASLSPAAFSMLGDSFPPNRLALPTGLFSAGVAVGTGGAFLAGGALYELYRGMGVGPFVGLFGPLAAWQSVFVTLGLAGLLILLPLYAFVKEPARVETGMVRIAVRSHDSIADVVTLLRREWRIFGPIILGYAMATFGSAGLAAWTPTMLVRSHGMSIGEVGKLLGMIFLVSGIVGSIAGGAVADFVERRGVTGAKLAIVCVAAALQIIPNLLGPLSSHVGVTLVCYAITALLGQIAAAPTAAALQLITPNRLRAKVNAIFFFTFNVLGLGLGPLAVALLSDWVFPGPHGLQPSIAVVAAVGTPIALILFLFAFRNFVARERGAGSEAKASIRPDR